MITTATETDKFKFKTVSCRFYLVNKLLELLSIFWNTCCLDKFPQLKTKFDRYLTKNLYLQAKTFLSTIKNTKRKKNWLKFDLDLGTVKKSYR